MRAQSPGSEKQDPSSILVVDDDDRQRAALRVVLELESYTILEASNGQEALDLLAIPGAIAPSVILLDLQMPEMSGWEFMEVLESDVTLLAISIIVISGLEPEAAKGRRCAHVAWIQKPYDVDELLRLVRTHSCSAATVKPKNVERGRPKAFKLAPRERSRTASRPARATWSKANTHATGQTDTERKRRRSGR
jgi:CheY-like chemotaxis protein